MKKINNKLEKSFLKYTTALVILVLCAYIFLPFMPPIIMGALLALALVPTQNFLIRKKISHQKSLLTMVLGIVFLAFAPTFVFFIRGSKMVNEYINNPEFIEKLKTLQNQLVVKFHDWAPMIGLKPEEIDGHVQSIATKAGTFFLSLFGSVVARVPDITLFVIIMLISMWVFLSRGFKIRILFDRYFNFSKENSDKFIQVLVVSSKTVFFSNVITGLIQALFVTIGAVFFGVGDWFLVLFITFISSFIPVIGAGPVAFVLALYSFLSGDNVAGVGLIVVAGISGAIDNILRPILVTSKEVEVPALISLLAVLGGVGAFGLKGLFLGPFITSVAFGVLPLIFEEHFGESGLHEESDM
jgi:predicted PurR-regulated permease PerM